MSDRNELFQLMLGRTTTKAVERILDAGYSKPRVITTREDLVALNARTIIRDADDETWELTDNGWHYWVYDVPFDSLELTLPATVLWEPQP